MVVLGKLDAETDGIVVKTNENNHKGRCLRRFRSSSNPGFCIFRTSILLTKLINYTTIVRAFCKAKRKSKLLIPSDGLETDCGCLALVLATKLRQENWISE